jgi:hypothetical protein
MKGSGFAVADTLVHGEGDHRRRKYTNALAENSGAPRAMTGGDGALPKKSGARRARQAARGGRRGDRGASSIALLGGAVCSDDSQLSFEPILTALWVAQ